MWSKPWKLKEGFAIAGGLIVVGLLLELSAGPVDWDALAWPANGVALTLFVAALAGMALLGRRVAALRFLATAPAAVPALTCAVALTVVMGLTRQTVGGVGLNNMLTFWPFVLIYVYVAVIVGLTAAAQLAAWARRRFALSALRVSLISHLGFLVALTCATIGNADMQRLKMIVAEATPEWRALDPEGKVVDLPLAVELQRFIMETYPDGSPRRFASEIMVLTREGGKFLTTVDVNRPAEVDGWKIYQYGYDTAMGADSEVSILELVSDPWQPAVYAGIYLMIVGSVAMFVVGGARRRGRAAT